MKILLSAFSCCPGAGSDPGVGWNWVQQISRRHEVWLITSDEYQSRIEKELPPNVHATYIPSFRLWCRLQQALIPGLDWLYYYWWQWKAYRVAQQLHTQHQFDLAHNVTFASWRAPSFLCLLPIPLIWGPVGGGGSVPPKLRSQLGLKGRIFEGFRHLAQQVSRRDPFVRLTMRKAAVIMAGNNETAKLVPVRYQEKVRTMACGGMSGSETLGISAPDYSKTGFTVLFVALLRPIKGGTLAVRTMRKLADSGVDARLIVIGGGSEGGRMAALARELGVSDRVRFLGGLPRKDVFGWMRIGDVLLFPSLRDSGPLVILEAMMAQMPVVCLDLGGPGYFVTEDCGIKITPGTAEEVTAGLTAALEKLAAQPSLRQKMGEAGRRRVLDHFDWDKRGERMMQIYGEVVEKEMRSRQGRRGPINV